MCTHKNIVVSHYVSKETNSRIGCRIRCKDCDEYLFESKDKGILPAYEFIELNKHKFDTLIDYTPDYLNDKFEIKDGLVFEI